MTPAHMSYSALSRYEECPRSYYLGKEVKAEEKMTWFFPIGTTVHNAVEAYIAKQDFSVKDSFYDLISKQMLIDPDDVNWLAGGAMDDPVMRDKALEQAEVCTERAIKFLDDIDVWEVEYDATGMLPGCEVPIKAYIDIIGEHKKYGHVIVDWKSGKQKPKNNLQLETYACLLNKSTPLSGNDHPFTDHGSIKFDVGLWAMVNPEASQARPVKGLAEVDPLALGERYQKAYDSIKERKWQANHGFHCRFCTQQLNCLLEAGPTKRAVYYDKSETEGYPY